MFGEGDGWLAVIFAPHRLAQTIREMQAAQAPAPPGPPSPARTPAPIIAGCDTRLARGAGVWVSLAPPPRLGL